MNEALTRADSTGAADRTSRCLPRPPTTTRTATACRSTFCTVLTDEDSFLQRTASLAGNDVSSQFELLPSPLFGLIRHIHRGDDAAPEAASTDVHQVATHREPTADTLGKVGSDPIDGLLAAARFTAIDVWSTTNCATAISNLA